MGPSLRVVTVLTAVVILTAAGGAYAQCPTAGQLARPVSPVDNASVTAGTRPTFTWNGATVPVSGYSIMLGEGTAGPFGIACSTPPAMTSCESTVPVGSGVTYTWFVRADGVAGCTPPGADSGRFTFTTTGGGPCPSFVITPAALANAQMNVAYSVGFTAAGGTAPYTFSIASGFLPPGLTLTSTGVLSGTPTTPGSSSFDLQVSDTTGCRTVRNYTLVVGSSCPAIVITPESLPRAIQNSPYTTTVTASGGTAPYNFSMSAGSLPPGLSLTSDGRITGTATTPGIFPFDVLATDSTGCTSRKAYELVVDGSVTCPSIVVAPAALADAAANTAYSVTFTASGGVAPYSFSFASGGPPPGLTLTASGVLSGTPITSGNYVFEIRATDSASCSGVTSYTLRIGTTGCATLSIFPVALANATLNTPYNVALSVSGGTPPFTFGISSGNLPAGLSLTSSGGITGTPTVSGTFAFDVGVVDSTGCTGTRSYTLQVGGTCPGLVIAPATLVDGAPNTPYSVTFNASGGVAPYSFSFASGGPPPGLTLTASGVLSGTPMTSGNYVFEIRATDSAGCSSVTSYTLRIVTGCATLSIFPVALANAALNTPYNVALSVSGGTPPYTFSMRSGSLPAGLSLTSSGGITGTPTVSGNFSFEVAVVDSAGCTGTRSYTLQVGGTCPGLVIAPATLVDGAPNTPYSVTFSASGGVAPYSFSFASGGTPPGLTLSASGVLSGTPITSGNYMFEIRATDSAGCSGVTSYTLRIVTTGCATLSIFPVALANAALNTPYNVALSVTGGGTPPYTFSMRSGSLPAGLSLTSSGGITGTPTVGGNFSFEVAVVDSAGCSGTRSYTLQVGGTGPCPSLVIAPATLPNASPPTPYSVTFTAAGGMSPYTFTITSGFLPPGLTLSTSGVLSGMPTIPQGVFSFGVRVTDSSGCTTVANYTLMVGTGDPRCPQSRPSLITPGEGSMVPTGGVRMEWTSVIDAMTYEVFAGLGGRTPVSIGSTGGTSLTPTLIEAGEVEWFVRAGAPGCTALDSVHARFTTSSQCINLPPILMTPPPGAIVTLPTTLSWSPVPATLGYQVYFSTPGAVAPTLVGSTTTVTQLTLSSVPAGTYQWFVKALFPGCPPTESARYSITISGGGGECPTVPPALVSPPNGAAGIPTRVLFMWGAVERAGMYRLLVSLNGGSPTPIAISPATQFTADLPSGASVEWSVEAILDNCPAVRSTTSRFTTAGTTTCPFTPEPPRPLSPPDGATNQISPVALQWSLVPGATSYRVSASINGAPPVLLGTAPGTQLIVDVPQGTIAWTVEAMFPGCPSTVSARSTFTVATGTQCSNVPATPIAPVDGASGVRSPVEFRWAAAPRATNYRLFVSLNGTTFDILGITADLTLTRIISPGSYLWYVESDFVGCPSQRSPTFRFTVAGDTACPAPSLNLVSPVNGATVTSPVILVWSPTAGAGDYRVWLAVDASAPVNIARTSSTTATIPVPSGNVEWYVEALVANCPAVISPRGRFTVPRGTTCEQNLPATLLAPISSEVSARVDFMWSPSPGASSYRLWAAPAGQPFSDLGTTVEPRLTRELPAGTYQWYVDSIFPACPPIASGKAGFTIATTVPRCGNDTPAAIAPGNDADGVSSPPTFLWSSVPNAVLYRLFASLDGGDFQLIGTTADTSLTTPTPPGTIHWFVEAVFTTCPSTRSAPSRFTVPRATTCSNDAAALFAPADNANVDAHVSFAWSAVSGAVRYDLMVRTGQGSPTIMAQTQATSVTVPLPAGEAEWWVVTSFASCPAIESRHGFFNVPETCDSKRPFLLTPVGGPAPLTAPVYFSWTPVRARHYKVLLSVDNAPPTIIASTTDTQISLPIPPGIGRATVEAVFDFCPALVSPETEFLVVPPTAVCRTPESPTPTVVGQALSATTYSVRWTPLPNISLYELQESTTPDFATPITRAVSGVSETFTHDAPQTPLQYYYRVRGVSSCSDERGPYSDVIGVLVVPPARTQASAEVGTISNMVQTIQIPGTAIPVRFTATADKPWLTVTPSSGIVDDKGVIITVTPDPAALLLGTNTGSVSLTYSGAGKWITPDDTAPPSRVPISVSLVTPVAPGGKNTPPPDSLIIPAVAHATGANNSQFESDVRVTNTSAQTIKYQINFTPSGVDGTVTGSSTTIQVEPGGTAALDDVLTSFFGATGGLIGVLEIRPLTSSSSSNSLSSVKAISTTVASSRTYNKTPNGTLGQFIPAIPFAQFIGSSTGAAKSILSLQQIAQSASYRTNFGVVEGSGEPAEVLVSIFNNGNVKMGEVPISLRAGEHRQINAILAANNIALEDGRIEVEVTSATGKVTAYASVVNNGTNDPLLVFPVLKGASSADRFVIPGAAFIKTDNADWRTDLRIFNSSGTSTPATVTFYPQGNPGAALTSEIVLEGGEVKAIDNVLLNLFNAPSGSGGSIVVTTPASSSLVATARTYNQTSTGTYGLFVPGVTPAESVGAGARSLQILQVEQSERYRTNIGIAETTGNGATVEVSVILPDSKATPRVSIPLAPNEFRQISVGQFGLGNVYNARVTLRVTSGTGKVTGYGSVIDAITQDPTYVPAQ
jgi:hypothetical protein